MKLRKLKSLKAGRVRRTVVALGLAGGLVGGLLLGAAPAANAAFGSAPGDLVLSPTTGPLTTIPTFTTTEGCPSGYQQSAEVQASTTGGSYVGASAALDASTGINLTVGFSGTLAASMGSIENFGGWTTGQTQELFVQCTSQTGDLGNLDNVMSTFVTYSTINGVASYTATASPPATSTSTTLTTSTNSPTTCTSVTLTATETPAVAGTVQFLSGTSDIGGAVAVNSSGVATTSTIFTTANTFSVTAVFTPTSSSYASSTSNAETETVTTGTACTTGAEPLDVSVPTSGSFTLTVPTGTVTLTVTGSTATGNLNPITVLDTRNNYPGWAVSGQTSAFTGSASSDSGQTIAGDNLGWAPNGTFADGAIAGPTVTPGTAPPNGLADAAQVLASAVPGDGVGTSSLGAALTLNIPATAFAGPYAATLTITAVTTGP